MRQIFRLISRYYPRLRVIASLYQEVWDTIFLLQNPKAISVKQLEELYRGASGECRVIKSPQSAPCASGRFGCWTCTVVRKDKSARELIRSGHQELEPFLQFRDWIAEFRNDPKNRWANRRNGNAGLGPFSMSARKEILRRIESLEESTSTTILKREDRELIIYLWTLDHVPRLDFRKCGPEFTIATRIRSLDFWKGCCPADRGGAPAVMDCLAGSASAALTQSPRTRPPATCSRAASPGSRRSCACGGPSLRTLC